MNKLLLNLCAGALLCGTAHAAVILNEPFNYVDGPLTTVSGGTWANHSGTAGQLDVASGKANVSQSESEDVNAFLSGQPYANGNLYASIVVNLSGLPSGTGGYFAHFKDDANGFRARVFTSITGASAGQFRVGIANGAGTAVIIPKDLSIGQDYTLVLRYDTGTGASTLWISPSSEGSTTDRVDGTDTATSVGIRAFAFRQAASLGILTVDDLKVGTSFGDVTGGSDPTLNPPSISSLPDQRIVANASTAELPFVIGDGESAASSLVPSAGSDNPVLVPVESVVFGGSESNRTVRVTPAANQQGSALISVTVTDENGNTASRNFRVTVGAPTISPIANQTMPKDTISEPIPFTVGDSENDEITISVVSTNEAVVPSVNVIIDGTGANRTATILPTPAVAGVTRITLIATDGFSSVSNSFVLTVFQTLGVDFADSFDYPDGSVVTNSAFVWGFHSAGAGQTGQTQVIQGQLALSSTQGEDINAFLLNSPYLPSGGWLLYSRFTVNFSARPSAAGDYFAHFRSAGNSFGARVVATTAGASAGKLRLGIANNTSTASAVIPVDIETNVTYTVVTRLNVGTGQSTLWINPNFESDASVTATDTAFPFEVWTYAFRQSGGIGSLVVDDLKIGTAFLDVITPRPSLTITHSGSDIQISWPTAFTGYTLQYKGDLSAATWTDYTGTVSSQGDNSVVRFSGVGGQRFFQLVK